MKTIDIINKSSKKLLCVCLLLTTSLYAQDRPRVLVVYYSREGHTRMVAQRLADRFNADIEAIIDRKKRTGPIGFLNAGKDAVAGNLTQIAPIKRNPLDYDIILIGTPCWVGNVTPAIRTFIRQYDISGKRIGLFGTSHITGIENALKQLGELISLDKSKNFPTLPLRHRDLKDKILNQKIEEFYKLVMATETTK